MNKMQAVIILAAASATLALDGIVYGNVFKCEADHQCESGYCYLETEECVPCVDCAWYLRQPSPWRSCVPSPHECGECMPGFEYEYLFDGTTRSFCVRQKEMEDGILNEKSPYLWIIIALCLGVVVLLIIGVRYYKVVKMNLMMDESDVEDPPPLNIVSENDVPPPSYDCCMPLLHKNPVSPAVVTSFTVVEKEDSILQQAVPFSNPGPPYGTGGPVENEVQDAGLMDDYQPDSDDDRLVINPGDETERCSRLSPPQLEDEDTMPSNWTPYGESSHVPEDLPLVEADSVTSSLSDIGHIHAPCASSNNREVLNDSGVSASCSHQSELSYAHEVAEMETLGSGQDTMTNSIRTELQRRRSDDDLSALSERKRQRRDSGSSSMKSMEPY